MSASNIAPRPGPMAMIGRLVVSAKAPMTPSKLKDASSSLQVPEAAKPVLATICCLRLRRP